MPPVIRTVRSGSKAGRLVLARSALALASAAGEAGGEGAALAQGELGLVRRGGERGVESLGRGLACVACRSGRSGRGARTGRSGPGPRARRGRRSAGLVFAGGCQSACGEEGEGALAGVGLGERGPGSPPGRLGGGARGLAAIGSPSAQGRVLDRLGPGVLGRLGAGFQVRQGGLGPVELEELLAGGALHLLGGDGAGDQALDHASGGSRLVGEPQGEALPLAPSGAPAGRWGPGPETETPLQAEGHGGSRLLRGLGEGEEQRPMQGRVEERRVDRKAPGRLVLGLRQGDLGVDLASPSLQAASRPWKAGPYSKPASARRS